MSFTKEIREKAKHNEAPRLVINKDNMAILKKGNPIVLTDSSNGKSYCVRIKEDSLRKTIITQKDIELSKVS